VPNAVMAGPVPAIDAFRSEVPLSRGRPAQAPGHEIETVRSELANALAVHPIGPHEVHRIKHGYPPTPWINALPEVTTP